MTEQEKSEVNNPDEKPLSEAVGVQEQEAAVQLSPVMGAIVQVLLIFVVASYLCTSIYAPGVFGHLAIGNWILAHGSLPSTDYWTAVGQGKPFIASTWLFSVVLSLVEQYSGETGLICFKLLSYLLLVGLLSHLFSERAKNSFLGTIVAFLVSASILTTADFEPSILGFVLFALLLTLSYRYMERGAGLMLLSIFVASAVYSAVYPSFVFALIVLCVLFYRAAGKAPKRAAFLAVTLIVSQLLPPFYGRQLYTSASDFFQFAVAEIGYRIDPASVYDYPFAFLFLLWLFLGSFLHCQPSRLRLDELLLALLVSILGMANKSLLSYSVLIVGLFCALVWGRASGDGLGNLGISLDRLHFRLSRIQPVGVSWIALCLIIPNVYKLIQNPVTRAYLPTAEVDYVLEKDLPFPLLNESVVGPYLVYRFADQRGEPKRLAAIAPWSKESDRALALSEQRLSRLEPGWERFFNFVSPNTVLCRVSSPLYYLLAERRGWRVVFQARKETSGVDHSEKAATSQLFSWAVFTREGAIE